MAQAWDACGAVLCASGKKDGRCRPELHPGQLTADLRRDSAEIGANLAVSFRSCKKPGLRRSWSSVSCGSDNAVRNGGVRRASVHGLASLILKGALGTPAGQRERAKQLTPHVVGVVLAGLRR